MNLASKHSCFCVIILPMSVDQNSWFPFKQQNTAKLWDVIYEKKLPRDCIFVFPSCCLFVLLTHPEGGQLPCFELPYGECHMTRDWCLHPTAIEELSFSIDMYVWKWILPCQPLEMTAASASNLTAILWETLS